MKNRASIIAEVTIVFVLFALILWTIKLIPAFYHWQAVHFEGAIISIFLGMVLVPIVALWFQSNESTATRFKSSSIKQALETGGKSFKVMMPVTFLSFPIVQMFCMSFFDWNGALIIAGWHLLAIPLLCWIFREQPQSADQLFSKKELGIILGIFVLSIPVTFALSNIHPLAAKIFNALIFIGLAEEFIFRGYIQTRLNQVFDRKYTLIGFSFGWGIIIASLLFGLMHVLSPGNPGHLAWGLWTFFGGVAFGIIREYGGSFLASAMVHGIIMIFPVLFS